MSEKKVLVGSPVTSRKLYALPGLISACKSLSYKNKEFCFVDNSPDNMLQETLVNFPFIKTIKSDFYRKDKDDKIVTKQVKLKDERVVNVAEEIPIREMMSRDLEFLRKKVLDEGFDYLFILEQDIVPHNDIIEKLLSYGKDVVSAFYWTSPKGMKLDDLQGFSNVLPLFKNAKTTDGQDIPELLEVIGFNEMYPSKLIKINHFGFGCTLISRKVFEKVKFEYDVNYKGQVDVHFYRNLAKEGFEAFVDTGLIVGHNHVDWSKEWKR